MAFDGATYYNLPTSSQAGGSRIGNEAVLQQARALQAARRGDGARGRGRGSSSSVRGRGIINRPATRLPANPAQFQQHQQYGYQAPQTSMMPEYNGWSHQQQQQQDFGGHHSLPTKPQVTMRSGQSMGWQQPQMRQFQQPYYPPQYSNFMPGQMFTADGYGVSPTAYMQPNPVPSPVQSVAEVNIARRAALPPFPSNSRSAYCELCNIKCRDDIHLIAHQRNEHARCCKANEGCQFEGLPDIVEIHEQDRHLIFRPGAKRETTKPDGPPGSRIQGTNVNLETEEDIAKWIAERKRKWPGSKNAEIQAERKAKRQAYEESSPANLASNADVANNGRGRGRGRGRGERIRGAGGLARGGQLHDNGWNRKTMLPEKQQAKEAQADHDSAGLSSDEDEEEAASIQASLVKCVARQSEKAEIEKERDSSEVNSSDSDDDDGPPEAIPTSRPAEDDDTLRQQQETEGVADDVTSGQSFAGQPHDTSQQTCQRWVTTGQCKFGKHCRYLHDPAQRPKKKVRPPVPSGNPFERDDLIGKLLHNEVRHEISDLVQVIDFLARNHWMENVELYSGHKEEVENRIKVVSAGDEAVAEVMQE